MVSALPFVFVLEPGVPNLPEHDNYSSSTLVALLMHAQEVPNVDGAKYELSDVSQNVQDKHTIPEDCW